MGAHTKQYLRNDVLERDDGTRHRLLHIERTKDEESEPTRAWLIHLDSALALPFSVDMRELHEQFKQVAPTSTKPAPAKSEASTTVLEAFGALRPPSAPSLSVATRAMERIRPLVANPDIYVPAKRNALLKERAQQTGGATPKTLLKDLRNWWQGGQTEDALIAKYANCGRPDAIGTAGRGASRADESRPYQLTEEDLAYMRQVIEAYYFDKDVRRTLTATLQHLHETKYTYVDGNGTVCLRPANECPSYRQLGHFLNSNYPLDERLKRRKGEKRFAQEDRSTQGSIQLECHGAGHIYEFDATIVDVKLVSSKDRSAIVGRPTLYLIIDRHSRLIVGFYLSFENANYSSAMEAILSIGQDKEALCQWLGIPYDPDDWVAHGILPEMFLADQGELTHKKARRIARSLRCQISNVPGLRPDWKPLVECGFAMIHQVIAPDTPAYVRSADNKNRRGINRDAEACLTLKEFTAIIVAAIIAHNKTMQADYPLSIGQVTDRVKPIPRDLFKHSLLRRSGLLDRMNYEKVRFELMPRDKVTLTADGMAFKRLHYSCPEAEQRGWLVEGRRKRKALDIAFDYRLVDEILVFSPDGSGEAFVAKLTKDSGKFAGMSYADVERHFHDVDELTSDKVEVKRQAMFQFHNKTKSIIAEAKAASKVATKGKKPTENPEERVAERGRERDSKAGVHLPPTATVPVAPPMPLPSAPSAQVIPLNRAGVASPAAEEPAPERPLTLKERLARARQRMN
jgi:hypothetical protein